MKSMAMVILISELEKGGSQREFIEVCPEQRRVMYRSENLSKNARHGTEGGTESYNKIVSHYYGTMFEGSSIFFVASNAWKSSQKQSKSPSDWNIILKNTWNTRVNHHIDLTSRQSILH
eukprot:scaffold13133_cov216-Skeletonema_marinoi.AAC.8